MSDLRKKAMTRLVLCAVALVASIIFSVLLLTGNLDGQTGSGDATSVTGDTTSAAAGVDDPTADSFPACLLYTSPSPRDRTRSRMPSSA